MAYYALDPWGGERGDVQAAIVASAAAAAWGAKVEPKDFLPDFLRTEADDALDMRRAAQAFAREHGTVRE